MAKRPWQVLIGDLQASRKIPSPTRTGVDRALAQAILATKRQFPGAFKLSPMVLKGDELEAVLDPGAPALTVLTYLRARFALKVGRKPALRAGIGWGEIDHMDKRSPFASEGRAFHRARSALDAVKQVRVGRLTGWQTGDETFDEQAGAILPLLDSLFRRLSVEQWEAIALRLEGLNLEQIARKLGIRFQAVHKRLSTGSWDEAHQAIRFLEGRRAATVGEKPAEAGRRKPRG